MTPPAILTDPHYSQLKRAVLDHTGLGYYDNKDEDFAMRVERRLAAAAISDCAAYLRFIERGAAGEREMRHLIAELTIGETYFFREREQLEALLDVAVPDLIARNQTTRHLRVWSAGCASGAEAYSLAFLLREQAPALAGWTIEILGTDINEAYLARAREGRFTQWAFREAPDLTSRYFQTAGKEWVLRREYRSWASFRHHNLVKDPPPFGDQTPADLILCRNVMIYFSPGMAQATVAGLWDALAEGGWLLVGHAEHNPQLFNRFRTVMSRGQTLYQKPGATAFGAAKSLDGDAADVTRVRKAPPAKPPRAGDKSIVTVVHSDLTAVRELADRGHWLEAERHCRELLNVHAFDAVAHFTYALIAEHSGSESEAEPALRRAIYLDRGFAMAHYCLGLRLYRDRSFAKGRRAFHNVLQLLRGSAGDELVPHGDGITAAELEELAKLHLALSHEG